MTSAFRYQGQIGAALVLGGVDVTGPQLFTVHPHGSTDKLPYVTMGSGSLAAMAVFESRWLPNMEVRFDYHPLPRHHSYNISRSVTQRLNWYQLQSPPVSSTISAQVPT
jgi:L-lactate permease